ncbi:MAG: DUF362 domain-containing protein [Rectinemataceae bacterium]
MDRREFMKRLAGLGAASASAALLGGGRLFASMLDVPGSPITRASPAGNPLAADPWGGGRVPVSEAFPQLVAVKGPAGTAAAADGPVRLFTAGIAALGGMGRFVAKGETVVVKPNIGWDVAPERAANTNPLLVAAIIEACLAAGAKRVYVVDHSCDEWRACYKNSGIEAAARQAGATVAPAGSESYYHKVEMRGATALSSVKVHELLLEADAIINVPVLKSHGGAGMTSSLKNLMGTVWDRQAFHFQGLDRCIAEVALAVRPKLTIVDASRVMLTGGPRGNGSTRYAELGMQILSPDIVAADAASAKSFGSGQRTFPYIGMAAALGLGSADLSTLDIRRIQL